MDYYSRHTDKEDSSVSVFQEKWLYESAECTDSYTLYEETAYLMPD